MNMKKTRTTSIFPMRRSWIVVAAFLGVLGALAAKFRFAA